MALSILSKNGRKKYHGSVNPPIYRMSTKLYESIQKLWEDEREMHTSLAYGRTGSPTVKELERVMAGLDGVKHGVATASGMSAIMIALHSFLQAGDHVVMSDAIYKCTRRYATDELSKFGIEVTFFDPAEVENIEDNIRPNTKIIFFESPGSGTMEILDIPLLVSIAKRREIITMMDNSWATPILFRPFDFGIDVVVQSLTKYVSGHSDNFAGMITCIDKVYKNIYRTSVNIGACPSPDNCYMAFRGLKTLEVRLKQHGESALKIAKWLKTVPCVSSVLHPALPESLNHEIWKRDFKGASGLFSFTANITENQLLTFMNSLRVFGIGLSWGGYESLLIPYRIAGIRSVSKKLQNEHYYFRISTGLEKYEDLVSDLWQAFGKIEI